jgi:hypothetical protein
MVERTKLELIDRIFIQNSIPIELYKIISNFLDYDYNLESHDMDYVVIHKFFDTWPIINLLIKMNKSVSVKFYDDNNSN